jgi:hypothetical protein
MGRTHEQALRAGEVPKVQAVENMAEAMTVSPIPIWKRGHLNVNDETAFPIEFVRSCIAEGYACVQVMLNPKHPDTSLDQVKVSYIRDIRATGAKVFGFVWADDFRSPEALFDFVLAWRQKSIDEKCAITGFVINCEDVWEAKDQAGFAGVGWSKVFLTLFRNHDLTKKLSLAINTYIGGGGIDLPAWMNRGARLYCQTFKEALTHEWPIDGYIPWAKLHGYTKPAMIKPNWSTYKAPDGSRASRAEQIASAKRAGTVGFCAWYAEGAGDPADVLIPLLREAKAAGVAY